MIWGSFGGFFVSDFRLVIEKQILDLFVTSKGGTETNVLSPRLVKLQTRRDPLGLRYPSVRRMWQWRRKVPIFPAPS